MNKPAVEEKKESAMDRLVRDLKSEDENTRRWARVTLFTAIVPPLKGASAWEQSEEVTVDE